MLKYAATLLFLISFILPVQNVFGQVIQTDPAFPVEDEPVTIIFDASEADRNELAGYDGDVYAHTGVILSEDDLNSGGWEYVIAQWTENISKAQLTPLGDDRWELEIENMREFYEMPEDEDEILQLAMVFRNADGSLQSEDLFIDIFNEEIAVQFNSPSVTPPNPYFAELNETI